jgi:hypothetical protein
MATEKRDSLSVSLRNLQSSSKFETCFPEVTGIKSEFSLLLRWYGSSNEIVTSSKHGEISGSEYDESKSVCALG